MLAALALAAALSTPPASVLILFAEDPSQPATQALEDGLELSVAKAGARAPILYFEYLDAARFEHAEYRTGLHRFLSDKYRDRTIDLIVPIGQSAIEFLATAGQETWAGVPTLFAATHAMTIDAPALLPDAAGIDFRFDFAEALPAVLALVPGTMHVALVAGTSALERARTVGSAEAVRRANLDPIIVSELTFAETLARVATLPPHSVAFINGPLMDAAGAAMPVLTLCRTISAASNSPAFMVASTQLLGCGTVGGRMRDFSVMGRLIGERILASLDRFAPTVQRVPTPQFTRLLFDARQLQRWGLDERRLPAGSTVEFREFSVWRAYRREILFVTAGLLLQSLLIVGLLYERRHRIRAQRESRANLAMAAHVDRRVAVATLTGSIAHELSQPLGSILHNADAAEVLLASNRATVDDLRDIIRDIRRDDTRAAQIVQRHRVMLKKHDVAERPIDICDVVRESVALLADEAQSRRVAVDVQLPPAPCVVSGDEVLLQQVVVNLMMNAMDAMADTPASRRRVVVGNAIVPEGVLVSVRDSGPGLGSASQASLFEPFVTTKPNGLGIGLSIVRSIVQAHGGTIAAANVPDGGAIFRFTLPQHAS